MIRKEDEQLIRDWAEAGLSDYINDDDFEDTNEAFAYAAEDCLKDVGLVDHETFDEDTDEAEKILREEWNANSEDGEG